MLFKFFFGIKFHLFVLTVVQCAGIMFQDITTLLLDPKAFKDTIDLFVERYKGKNISVVAGKRNVLQFFFSFLFSFFSCGRIKERQKKKKNLRFNV